MLYKTRVSFLLGAFMALFLIALPASALSLPGFPIHTPSIKAPKMVEFCERVMNVAGITITVPRICKDIPPPPPAIPQLAFTATPESITEGEGATLAWDSTDATTCTASGGWTGQKTLDGSEIVTPAETTNYILTCTNGDNSVVKEVSVVVSPPAPTTGTLVVKKILVQDDGRTEMADSFSFMVNGGTATAFDADGQNDVTVNAGMYSIVEVEDPNYTTTYDNCTDVVVPISGSATCTITNDDKSTEPTMGTLIVDKVTQPEGDITEFTIVATGSGAITGGGSGTITDATNQSYEVEAGTYSVDESALAGWQVVSNTCVDVVVAAGATETCTITNAKLPIVTVTKIVVNDDGASKQIADFPLFIDGVGVVSGEQNTVSIGEHTVSETGDANYTSTIGGDCAANGAISLVAGDVKSCTITNDDIAPAVNHLLISEVHYDPDSVHGGEDNEWVEIYNPTNAPVDLTNWWIGGTTTATMDRIPDGTSIAAGGYLVISNSSTTPSLWTIPVGAAFVSLESPIGNGLSNTADVVMLIDATGATTTVDAMSWGTNSSGFASGSGAPDVAEGHSLERISLNVDTDTAADWTDTASANPGQ